MSAHARRTSPALRARPPNSRSRRPDTRRPWQPCQTHLRQGTWPAEARCWKGVFLSSQGLWWAGAFGGCAGACHACQRLCAPGAGQGAAVAEQHTSTGAVLMASGGTRRGGLCSPSIGLGDDLRGAQHAHPACAGLCGWSTTTAPDMDSADAKESAAACCMHATTAPMPAIMAGRPSRSWPDHQRCHAPGWCQTGSHH